MQQKHDKTIRRWKRILAVLIFLMAAINAYSIVAFGFLATLRMLVAAGIVVIALVISQLIFSGIPLKEFWEMRSFIAEGAKGAFWDSNNQIQ